MLKAMSNVYSLHYKLFVAPDVTNGFCCVQCRRCTIFSSVRFFPTSYPKAARFQQLTTWSESETWAGLPRSCCDDEYCSSTSVVPKRSSSRYYKTRGEAREEEDREVDLSLRETEAKRSGREAGKEMVQLQSMLCNWDRYSFGGCDVVVERRTGREFCEEERERDEEHSRSVATTSVLSEGAGTSEAGQDGGHATVDDRFPDVHHILVCFQPSFFLLLLL